MDKAKASLLSEATLWGLYKHALAAELLLSTLPAARRHRSVGAAVAAALAQVRADCDLVAPDPTDLATRACLGGARLDALRASSIPKRATRAELAPVRDGDRKSGILPGVREALPAIAVGAATALHAADVEACVFLVAPDHGEAASGLAKGAWASAIEAATTLHLPLVFVVDRRGAGPGTPKPNPRQPAPAMPTIPVDRDDALAIYRVLYEAAARAREGTGPSLAECCEARLPDGTPLSDEGGAVARLEAALSARKLFARERARSLRAAVERELGG